MNVPIPIIPKIGKVKNYFPNFWEQYFSEGFGLRECDLLYGVESYRRRAELLRRNICGPMMPIAHERERLIIARLVIAVMKARAEQYYPGLGLAATYEMQLIATAVFIGHVSRKPMGATEIGRYVGMPRATVLRRLSALMRRNLVAKKGRRYCIVPEAVNGPTAAAVVRGNIRRIIAAAKELSKMDENATTSGT